MADKTKKTSIIKLDPQNELSFNMTESGAQISSQLKLENPTSQVILFKVKTTAPKDYCVRPNSGTLASGQSIDINVMLQNSASKKGKSKDKFLVQTVCESDVPTGAEDAFKFVDKAVIMEDKLRCNWIFESGGGHAPTAGGTSTQNDAGVSASTTQAGADPVVPSVAAPKTTTQNADATPTTPATPTKPAAPARAPDSIARQMRQANNATAKKPESGAAAAAERTTTAAKTQEAPSLILLLIVFILGYIFGKFVM